MRTTSSFFAAALVSALSFSSSVVARPVMSEGLAPRAFSASAYTAFQISGGTGGNAAAEANAVFVDPFGSDLASVSAADLKSVQTMREAAEAEEAKFNSAIASASGDQLAALKVGKTKNKVLKLTGEVQALKIQQAQGKDTSAKIAAEQKKLTNNINLDTANKGAASATA